MTAQLLTELRRFVICLISKICKPTYSSVQLNKGELFFLVCQVVDTQRQVNRYNALKKVMSKTWWKTRLANMKVTKLVEHRVKFYATHCICVACSQFMYMLLI